MMLSGNVNVRIGGELRKHLNQQIGVSGSYENASEYIRDLIRQDIKSRREAWDWLAKELAPALTANEVDYVTVSADEVISRNKKRKS